MSDLPKSSALTNAVKIRRQLGDIKTEGNVWEVAVQARNDNTCQTGRPKAQFGRAPLNASCDRFKQRSRGCQQAGPQPDVCDAMHRLPQPSGEVHHE